MIAEANQIRLLVEGLGLTCYMSFPETAPTGSFAVLSVTSSVPDYVDADGTECITTYDYNIHLYVDGSRWDAFGYAESLSALLSSYRMRRLGLSEAYSPAAGRVHIVMAFSETIDERGNCYMER